MIELKGVNFSYASSVGSRRPVFEGLNLRIPQGRYAALMGPNGSGKSTLGKLIKGLLSPSSGEVRIGGQPLRPGEVSPRVGFIFSNPENQIVSSVVEEDVAFGLGNQGMDPRLISARVEESLRMVGMAEYRTHSPHLLSGGQQQKVVIAGILAMECEVLVLDEPTSMLDPQDRTEILDLLQKIHGQGERTLLHITHSGEEALRAQDLIFLHQGRVIFFGTPMDFFAGNDFPDPSWSQLSPLIRFLRGWRDRGYSLPPGIRSWEELRDFLLQTFSSLTPK